MTGTGPPKPGDYTVCINCSEILRYGGDLILYKIELDEVDESCRAKVAKMVSIIPTLPGWAKRRARGTA